MKSLRYGIVLLFACLTAAQSVAAPFRLPMQSAKLAELEATMWRAYYEQDYVRLSYRIYQLFSEEFTLSTYSALRASIHATKAASIMRSLPHSTTVESYQELILPHLTKFFDVLKKDLNGSYDSQQVAKAELAWWITRRTKERNDLKKIGLQIAKVYSLLTNKNNPHIDKAGYLRAKAAWIRDEQNGKAGRVDWPQIESLLKQSYENLAIGLQSKDIPLED